MTNQDLADDAAAGQGGQPPHGDTSDVLITKEGLKKLQEELDYLKTTRQKEIAKRLKEAISYGDLSENSEYEEAKNEQAFIQGRILELEKKIKNAKIITGVHAKVVKIGSEVTIRNITGRGEPETYIIVGTTEADPFRRKISNESPVGAAIMEKEKGDKVRVNTPAGECNYEIVDLK